MTSQFDDQLRQLNILNETKGKEQETLDKVKTFRQKATEANDPEALAESWWLEHLAHQHLVMNNEDPEGFHRSSMLTSAQNALKIVLDTPLDPLRGKAHRFMGRAYTYANDHRSAETEYSTARDLLRQSGDPRYLEVAGFLAESMVRNGRASDGLSLAYQTFDEYDQPPALTLKKVDYYTWAVWRSGIFPRLIAALDELKIDYDKLKVKSYLDKSQEFLNDPQKFAYRVSEINSILQKYYLFFLAFVPHFKHLV